MRQKLDGTSDDFTCEKNCGWKGCQDFDDQGSATSRDTNPVVISGHLHSYGATYIQPSSLLSEASDISWTQCCYCKAVGAASLELDFSIVILIRLVNKLTVRGWLRSDHSDQSIG